MLKLFRSILLNIGAIGLVITIMDVLTDLWKEVKSRKYLPVIYSSKLHLGLLIKIFKWRFVYYVRNDQ